MVLQFMLERPRPCTSETCMLIKIIAKFMFYYQNQLLPPMLLNLFLTSSQVHNYGTNTANHYRSHSCRTNLKQYTFLYQGPKIRGTQRQFLSDALKRYLRLSGVPIKLCRFILGSAIIFLSVWSF